MNICAVMTVLVDQHSSFSWNRLQLSVPAVSSSVSRQLSSACPPVCMEHLRSGQTDSDEALRGSVTKK
jgi:hypothetical protein